MQPNNKNDPKRESLEKIDMDVLIDKHENCKDDKTRAILKDLIESKRKIKDPVKELFDKLVQSNRATLRGGKERQWEYFNETVDEKYNDEIQLDTCNNKLMERLNCELDFKIEKKQKNNKTNEQPISRPTNKIKKGIDLSNRMSFTQLQKML